MHIQCECSNLNWIRIKSGLKAQCEHAFKSFTLLVYLFLSRLYNKMTMEVILSTAFGRAIDVQGGNGGKLFEAAVTAFGAFSPSKEDEGMSIYRIIQVAMGKSSSSHESAQRLLTADQLMSLYAIVTEPTPGLELLIGWFPW